jgi:MFS family permease
MYGHKPVFSIGSAIGGAMFLGMGLAQNKIQLFIFRALAGVAYSGWVHNYLVRRIHAMNG